MSGFIVVLIVMTIFLTIVTIAAGLYLYNLIPDKKVKSLNTQWDYSFGLLLVILLILGWKVLIDYAMRF